MRCAYCGSQQHTVMNCPKTYSGAVRHRDMRCSYCGGLDHFVEACPKTWTGSAARRWNSKSVEDYFVLDKRK